MIWLALSAGIVIGFYLGLFSSIIVKNKNLKEYQNKIEGMFSSILDNFSNLKFSRRINRYAYFIYQDWEIIYQLDNKTIHIFSKEECLATSKQLDESKTILNLISEIENKWSIDMNNTIVVDNNILSMNYFEEQRNKVISNQFSDPMLNPKKEEYIPSIDDILDKINKVGFINLSDEEKNILRNSK